MDKAAFVDSMSYILAREAFRESMDSLELRDQDPLPDSLLMAFLLGELSDSEVEAGAGLKDLCAQYSAPMDVPGKYDSIQFTQMDFIGDFLRENKNLSPGRFDFSSEVPDSLPSSRYDAVLHVIFRSLDSGGE
jgi:hypothetical protein